MTPGRMNRFNTRPAIDALAIAAIVQGGVVLACLAGIAAITFGLVP